MTYTEPGLFLILLILAGSVATRKWRGVYVGMGILFLWSWPPVSWLSAWALESAYPPLRLASPKAQAVVVFSGNQLPRNEARPQPLPGRYTYERVMHAVWVWKESGGEKWVVASGGPGEDGTTAARVMGDSLAAYGVTPSRIVFEERSQSTYDNARFTAALLKERGLTRVALVTSARHMWRAAACLRKQGIEVEPCAAAFASRGVRWSGLSIFPSAESIEANEEALHELIGFVWYWLRGRL